MNRLLLFLLVSGCSEYNISQKLEEPVGAFPRPAIEVNPSFLDLGVGDGTVNEGLTGTVFVTNVGDDDLVVGGLQLTDPFYSPSINDVWIAPNETIEILVSYTAIGDVTSLGELVVYNNDTKNPEPVVGIAANALAPMLYLEPTIIDFDEIGITCIEERFFTVGNTGRLPLEIQGFDDSLMENFYTFLPDKEAIIQPNEVIEGYVGFTPTEPLSHFGEVVITTNAWNTRHGVLDVSGTGIWGPDVTDTFEQVEVINADILFIIDNSCSMSDEQAALSSNAGLFMSSLDMTGVDYQVGIITTDFPGLVAPVITPSSPDPISNFSSAVMVGTAGSATETGLEMGMQATEIGGPVSAASGFIRESSIFAAVVISDEDDFSLLPTLDYIDHFLSLKANSDETAFHSVVDFGAGCGSIGTRYIDTSTGTSGLTFDLCTGAWGSFLEAIVDDATTPVNTFNLSEEPVEETIAVYIDSMWETRWTYYSDPSRIVFDQDAVPRSLSEVTITYSTWPNCD